MSVCFPTVGRWSRLEEGAEGVDDGHVLSTRPTTPRATLPSPEGPGLRPTDGGNGHPRPGDQAHPAAADQHPTTEPVAAPRTIRVLLVDDHAAVRQAFVFALNAEVGIEVVAEAASGPAALEQVARLRPDLVLMDINLPGMNGVEATRRIRAEFPEVQVIALSMYESEEQGAAMCEAGARAYVGYLPTKVPKIS